MPLLRLQSDERLVALVRRGHNAAFETLVSRYEARLLSFCRHMLASKEDAEDVLQEVFAAAFNALLADEREINVRPWLYRIARNRSLNHLRRATAVGVDSMDIHFADNGQSTGEKVLRRESFRQLIADVQQLPETQRTALLLREIDALSYDQIADAMETTVPSVKSLLVRARISLAEAAEARKLSCDEVRFELAEVAEGLVKITPPVRRHVRECERCRSFRGQLKANNQAMAAVFPVSALLMLKKLLLAKVGSTAGAGGAHVAGAGSASATAAGVAGTAGATGGTGLVTAGIGALATKAAAGLAVAGLVTAGAVEVGHVSHQVRRHPAPVAVAAVQPAVAASAQPVVVSSSAQPVSGTHVTRATVKHDVATQHKPTMKAALLTTPAATTTGTTTTTTTAATATTTTTATTTPVVVQKPEAPKPPATQVMTDTTVLPAPSTTPSTTDTQTAPPPPTDTTPTVTDTTTTPATTTPTDTGTGATPPPTGVTGPAGP